jgi:hypothetical protein
MIESFKMEYKAVDKEQWGNQTTREYLASSRAEARLNPTMLNQVSRPFAAPIASYCLFQVQLGQETDRSHLPPTATPSP